MISEFPLFVFTTLGGIAAGAYVLAAIFPAAEKRKRPWLLPLICLVLLGVGGLMLLGHLGHPERMLNALANPSAGIAQEAYAMIAFGIVVLVDAVLCFAKGSCSRWLRIVGAVCAILMTIAMGMAYFTVSGIEAWASWETLPLFVVGDLAMGAAFLALLETERYGKAGFAATFAALGVLTAVSFALVGAHFAGVGCEAAPFVVGAVLALVGTAFGLLAWKGKLPAKTAAALAFAFMLVGVAVARYAFYAASIL